MSLVFSVKQTGVPLGGALAGAIVPGLQVVAGWQLALLLVAVACIACALVAQSLRGAFDADRDTTRGFGMGNFLHPVRMVLAHPALRMLAGCSFIFSIAPASAPPSGTPVCLTENTSDMRCAGVVRASRCELAGVIGP